MQVLLNVHENVVKFKCKKKYISTIIEAKKNMMYTGGLRMSQAISSSLGVTLMLVAIGVDYY